MKSPTKKLEFLKEVLVYVYIWQIPFSWRFIIDPSRSQISSVFNEYMDISLYLGEILLIIALTIHILEYIIQKKSIVEFIRNKIYKMFHVEHFIFLSIAFLLLINALNSVDPILSSAALFHWFLLGTFFYLFKKIYVSRGTKFIESVVYIFLVSLFIQFCLAFIQVTTSTSVGLRFLNESVLSLERISIAKSHIFSDIYLRAYGTFPHPNILAVYAILVMIFFDLLCSEKFHVKQWLSIYIKFFSIAIVILTQSKLAIFAAVLYIVHIFLKKNMEKKFHVKQFLVIFLLALISLVTLYYTFQQDIKTSFDTRNSQYIFQVKDDPADLIGVGLGTYRLSYDSISENWWNYEPVHFIPLLVLKELGLLILLLIGLLFIRYCKKVPRETFRSILFPTVLVLLLFSSDHYAWDIYQGMFLVVLFAAIIHNIDK